MSKTARRVGEAVVERVLKTALAAFHRYSIHVLPVPEIEDAGFIMADSPVSDDWFLSD